MVSIHQNSIITFRILNWVHNNAEFRSEDMCICIRVSVFVCDVIGCMKER